jgi:3-phosphoinositide dependent protein kinase-1
LKVQNDHFKQIEEENKGRESFDKVQGDFVGTAEYVSPEMLNVTDCGKEGDLWALGVIIYQLFNGKTPFIAKNEY